MIVLIARHIGRLSPLHSFCISCFVFPRAHNFTVESSSVQRMVSTIHSGCSRKIEIDGKMYEVYQYIGSEIHTNSRGPYFSGERRLDTRLSYMKCKVKTSLFPMRSPIKIGKTRHYLDCNSCTGICITNWLLY